MNKIHSCVLSLCWHPEKDNLLAFSTREGRIGVLDVNKSSNVPVILTSFSSQEIYSIAWAKLKLSSESMILIACNGQKLVYYSQKDQYKMTNVDHLKQSASVAVNENLLAIGYANGDLKIVDISNEFRVLLTKKISRKYLGMMSWHKDSLAVSSESGITLIRKIDHASSEIHDENLLKLQGHKGRVFSVRFNKSGSLLVSSCISCYVKVWDMNTLTAIASFSIETPAYSSIFLPSNEDIIVCGGQDSTVLTREWRKYPINDESQEVISKKNQIKIVQWASPTEVTTISKTNQRRHKKKILKTDDDSVSELSSEVVKMNLHPVSSTFTLFLNKMKLTFVFFSKEKFFNLSFDKSRINIASSRIH